MPWPANQRTSTHQRILDSAARLFALHGFDQVSIEAVMREANLTRGAFYHHFSSKTKLYNEAMRHAVREGSARFECAGTFNLQRLVEDYLHMDHRDGKRLRCPLAFLISDVASQQEAVRQNYTQILERFVAYVENGLPEGHRAGARQQALQIAVNMIGGLALARATASESMAREVLDASREACALLIGAT